MTADDDREIINGIDVDHLEDRPDRLEHVAIEESGGGELRALPFNESDTRPPGYVEIDVDLMRYDEICRYVETVTDYDRFGVDVICGPVVNRRERRFAFRVVPNEQVGSRKRLLD